MAKKKTVSEKKVSQNIRDAKNHLKDEQAASSAQVHDGIEEQRINLLPTQLMEDTIEGLESLMEDFRDVSQNNLNTIQRRRKIGAGIKNYGFIEKVADLAEANSQFAQFFRPEDLRNCIINFDRCRDIALILQSFARLVTNTMLVYSDTAYGMALIFYNNVKEMGRRGNPTAMELFRALQPFFKRTRHDSANMTEKQTDRELHALMHGKKDGKLVVENITPKLSGGVHKVVEEVYNDKASIKESIEANEKK